MKFSILVVAILAFSTSIDLSEAADCYRRTVGAPDDGTKAPCFSKCYAYIHTNGNNIGACDTAGCDNAATKLWCKECTDAGCNTRASIAPKCYVRNAGDTAPGASTACMGTPPAVKCISYYDTDGNNLGKCLDGGCSDSTVSSLPCKDCTAENCNVKSLVTTTAAPTTAAGGAAPTTPRAAATRASVGWQTEIMAASVCVLVVMKPF